VQIRCLLWYNKTMETLRVHHLKVGGLYRWALGDPDEISDEIFLVLGVPSYVDPIQPNKLMVLSNMTSRMEMHVFASDKFYRVA
jgi:hypothetical protein